MKNKTSVLAEKKSYGSSFT